MKTFSVGTDGALYLDEKMNIQGSVLPGGVKEEPFSLCFALGHKQKAFDLSVHFSKMKCAPGVLGAQYKFEDKSCPAKIKTHAFTPFDLNEDAHLSAAVFSFKIKNTAKKKRKFTFGVCLQNPSVEPIHSVYDEMDAKAVLLGSAHTVSAQPAHKSYCICMLGATGVLRYADKNKNWLAGEENRFRSNYAALLRHIELESGDSETVKVLFTWHMPNLKFKQETGEDICFKNGYAVRFNSAVDVARYVLKNLQRLTSAPLESVNRLKDYMESEVSINHFIKNIHAILAQKPYRLEEFGKGKAFYKNRLKAPVLFAYKDVFRLWSEAFAADINSEAEQIKFMVEYCVDFDENRLTLPRITEGTLYWDEHIMDCASACKLIFRTYRIWQRCDFGVFSDDFWSKLQRIWQKVIEPETVRDIIFYNSALVCMQKMCKAPTMPLKKEFEISDCDFSVMSALWMSIMLGIQVFDDAFMLSFLDFAYLQYDLKLCSSEDVCAYLCLLVYYERAHLASALCKTCEQVFDEFLIVEQYLNKIQQQ